MRGARDTPEHSARLARAGPSSHGRDGGDVAAASDLPRAPASSLPSAASAQRSGGESAGTRRHRADTARGGCPSPPGTTVRCRRRTRPRVTARSRAPVSEDRRALPGGGAPAAGGRTVPVAGQAAPASLGFAVPPRRGRDVRRWRHATRPGRAPPLRARAVRGSSLLAGAPGSSRPPLSVNAQKTRPQVHVHHVRGASPVYPSEVKEKPAESGTRVAVGSTARGHRYSGLSQSEPNPPKDEITAACSDCPGGRRGQTAGTRHGPSPAPVAWQPWARFSDSPPALRLRSGNAAPSRGRQEYVNYFS